MGKVLIRATGRNQHVTVKDLSDDFIDEMEACRAELYKFADNYQLMDFVEINFNSLIDFIESQSRFIPSSEVSEVSFPFNGLLSGVHLHLLNMLSSSRTFLDHMEANIKREFGSTSKQYEYFKGNTSFEFDNFFHYQFIYKLRNFVQHCGLPHIGYSFRVHYTKHEKGRIGRSEMEMFFYRDSLIESYDGWGSIVKSNLLKQDEKFNFLDVINGYMNSLRHLYCTFSEKYWLDSAVNAGEKLQSMIGEKSGFYQDTYAILDSSLKVGEKGRFGIDWIPCSLIANVDRVKLLRKHLDSHKNTQIPVP